MGKSNKGFAKIKNMEDVLKYKMQMHYTHQMCSMIENILHLKFRLNNLEVDFDDNGMINILFDDDGVHTKEIVLEYLNQVRDEVSNYNFKELPNLHKK